MDTEPDDWAELQGLAREFLEHQKDPEYGKAVNDAFRIVSQAHDGLQTALKDPHLSSHDPVAKSAANLRVQQRRALLAEALDVLAFAQAAREGALSKAATAAAERARAEGDRIARDSVRIARSATWAAWAVVAATLAQIVVALVSA